MGRATRDFGGGSLRSFEALRLANFVQFEPGGVGTFLSTPPVDLGGDLGWSFSVLGGAGKSVADPLDGWYAVGPPMTDVLGRPLTPSDAWTMLVDVVERTAFDLSSDIEVLLGVMSEASDSGTVDGVMAGLLYTAASRNGRKALITNGVATVVGGGGNASTRHVSTPLYKVGTGAASVLYVGDSRTLDSARAPLTATLNTGDGIVTAYGDTVPRLVVSVHRTSITDVTTRAGTVSFYAQPPTPTPIPG